MIIAARPERRRKKDVIPDITIHARKRPQGFPWWPELIRTVEEATARDAAVARFGYGVSASGHHGRWPQRRLRQRSCKENCGETELRREINSAELSGLEENSTVLMYFQIVVDIRARSGQGARRFNSAEKGSACISRGDFFQGD